MKEPKGYVSFVLHAHLPFIHHPESEDYLEEQWLFEAISETYIPLLLNYQKLVEEKVDFRITMSMTPPLLNMLDNKLLQQRYIAYLNKHIELAQKEIKRTENNPQENQLAHYYFDRYSNDLHVFHDIYQDNIISGFKHFQDIGVLEIITCGATHGYFPILYITEQTVKAQIAVGVQTYEKYFGRKPRGIWLPECGYVPEADKYLKKFGIEYVITESHGILYASPAPVYGTYAPIVSPTGVIAFGRDMESSRQVWSSINGYPGDFNYREFYRDIGYDVEDYEYIKPYIASNGVRVSTGIKYHRITGKTGEKDYYNLQWAKDSAEMQAGHFMNSRIQQIHDVAPYMNKPPIILCPYDAELYGHWWYEGPYWLYILFKKIYYDQDEFSLITPSEYIDKYPSIQVSTPCRSSWGANGYSEVWLNPTNDYVHRHLHVVGNRMVELANLYANETDKIKIATLNQCARELLLAQSSDWLFIITNGTMVDYAKKRIKDHIGRFNKLYEQIKTDTIDTAYLKQIQEIDCIFSEINYDIYR